MKKLLQTKLMLIVLLLVAGMIILTPYIIRLWDNNPYMINSESYLNMRLYNGLDWDFYDTTQERHVPVNLMYMIPFRENPIVMKFLFFTMGIVSVVLTFLILKKYDTPEKTIIVIMWLLIISPVFIYTFMDFNPYAISVLIGLLSIYLFMHQKEMASIIVLCISPFIDIYGAMICVLFIAVHIIAAKKIKEHRLYLTAIILPIIASIVINAVLGYDVFNSISFDKSNMLTDIGASIGFSFSAIILSIIGMVLLWNRDWKNLLAYSILIALAISAFFNQFARIYLNFAIATLGGFAFMYLNKRKWSIPLIKRVTLLLIICSLAFTSMVYITKLSKARPDKEYIDAFNFIKDNNPDYETVLSSETNGYMIEYYSESKAFIDGKTMQYDPGLIAIYANITSSRNLERTENLLKTHKIRYILPCCPIPSVDDKTVIMRLRGLTQRGPLNASDRAPYGEEHLRR